MSNIKVDYNVRSRTDERDYSYKISNAPLRVAVDLREYASPVDSQRMIGTCVSSALINAYELMSNQKSKDSYIDLSRLFVYYNGRKIEGSINEDSGITIRSGLKAMEQYGLASEVVWPFDPSKLFVEPTPDAYKDAQTRKITNYQHLSSITDIIDAVNRNIPVIIGIDIFSSFMTASGKGKQSLIGLPEDGEETYGGHAVCVTGFDVPREFFIIKNSFGTDWGDNGYGYLTFDYVDTYSFEMWIFDLNESIVLPL